MPQLSGRPDGSHCEHARSDEASSRAPRPVCRLCLLRLLVKAAQVSSTALSVIEGWESSTFLKAVLSLLLCAWRFVRNAVENH